MVRRGVIAILGLGGWACGPSAGVPDGSEASSDDTAGASTGADGDAEDAGGDGSTTMEQAPGDSTSTSAGDATSESTTAVSDTAPSDVDDGTTAETGEPGDAEYAAIALPGGLDRIRITKRDLVGDRCMWIVLVAPELVSAYEIATPGGWSVESVRISDYGPACDVDTPEMGGFEEATAASGTIAFDMLGAVYPCSIDVDVSADFAGMLPMIPPTDTMSATAIPVTGC